MYFKGWLPNAFLQHDRNEFEYSILTNFLICIAMPINELKITIWLVPVYIITSYLQVSAETARLEEAYRLLPSDIAFNLLGDP